MEISIKDSFSKENGTVVERFYFLMRQYNREYGCRIRNNDIVCSLIIVKRSYKYKNEYS